MSETGNIQRSTPNAQRPSCPGVAHAGSMLDVECWVLNVFPLGPEAGHV